MAEIHKVREYMPKVYDGVLEMEQIMKTGQYLLNKCRPIEQNMWDANFILKATKENGGLEMFEELLDIFPSPDETEEFRQQRVLERWNWKPPYTIKYLKSILDKFMGKGYIRESAAECTGEGAYEMYVDYDNYAIFVESSQLEQLWAEEITVTIKNLKPCNMTFLNRIYINQAVKISEEIYINIGKWNYVLGQWALGDTDSLGNVLPFLTSTDDSREWNYKMEGWPLGIDPFASILEGDIIKMASQTSITNNLLHINAQHTADSIDHVVLNEGTAQEYTIERADFRIIGRQDESMILTYLVTSEMVNSITTISLYDEDNHLLSKSDVVIPVIENAELKHKILFKEAV